MSTTLRIAEIFTSIQGEGHWVGQPSLFIRVSGCNLRCTWCDTPYASWNPEGPIMNLSELEQVIAESPVNHLVITGGEPMIFDAVVELCKTAKALGRIITIETAGTSYRELPCDLMSISPKLSHSNPSDPRHNQLRLQPQVLNQLIERYPCQLKFVVQSPRDVEEIDHLVSQLHPLASKLVMLMPLGTNAQEILESAKALVPLAVERNWRLSPRWHVDLFGNTRGT